jgi:hypothetical protein
VNDEEEEEMVVMLVIEILNEKTFQIMDDRENLSLVELGCRMQQFKIFLGDRVCSKVKLSLCLTN